MDARRRRRLASSLREGSLAPMLALSLALAGCRAAAGDGSTRSTLAAPQQAPGSATKQDASPPLPEPAAALLRLYDEAGFPDVSRLERINRFSGVTQAGDGAPTAMREDAWVIRRGVRRQILLDSLWTEDLPSPDDEPAASADVPPAMRAPVRPCKGDWCDPKKRRAELRSVPGAEPLEKPGDFIASLRAQLDRAAAPSTEPDEEQRARSSLSGRDGPPEVLWLTRARWAEAKGDRGLALRALAQADQSVRKRCRTNECDVAAAMRDGLAEKLLWQAIDGLSNFMPRPEALDRARRAIRVAPSGTHIKEATELAAALERAVAEDAAFERRALPDRDKLSPEQKIEELVYRLRDQNGHQMSQPGACDPFDVGPGARSPAQELIDVGRSAVPRLIQEIGSPIPTRSIGYHRDFYFSHRALTVGDLAILLIERLTSKSFSAEGKAPDALRAEIAAHWSKIASMSEKDLLIDSLRAGGEWQRPQIAHRLLSAAGMDAWDELLRAFKGTKDPRARASMLDIMSYGSRVSTGQGNTIVLNTKSEVKGPERDRVVRFLSDGLADAAPEVRRAAAKALADRGDARGGGALLKDILAANDESGPSSYEAGEALARVFSMKVPGAAAKIAGAIQRNNTLVLEALPSALRSLCQDDGGERCKLPPADVATLTDALAQSLSSTSTPFDGSVGSGARRPRDFAALSLGALRGAPDIDVWSRGMFEGERSITAMLNAYRAEKRLPPLVRPDLEIPAPPASPGPDASLTVRRTHEQSDKPSIRTMGQAFLAPLQGKVIDADALTAALVDLGAKDPLVGWKLWIVRFPDERGVVLFLRGWPLPPNPSQMSLYSIECAGSDACQGGTMQGGGIKDAIKPYAKDIRAAWQAKPKGGEEHTLTLIGEKKPANP